MLLRPRRLTERGRREYGSGNHPQALEAFESAAKARPSDPAVRFNMADGLYKNGKYDEAIAAYRSFAGASVPELTKVMAREGVGAIDHRGVERGRAALVDVGPRQRGTSQDDRPSGVGLLQSFGEGRRPVRGGDGRGGVIPPSHQVMVNAARLAAAGKCHRVIDDLGAVSLAISGPT